MQLLNMLLPGFANRDRMLRLRGQCIPDLIRNAYAIITTLQNRWTPSALMTLIPDPAQQLRLVSQRAPLDLPACCRIAAPPGCTRPPADRCRGKK